MTVLKARLPEHDYEKQTQFTPKGVERKCAVDWMKRMLYYDIW